MKGKQQTRDEDLEYVSLCRQGDVDAFEPLVRRHQKRMINIAYRIVGDYDEACEVVQDAFISAYKNIKGFKGKARFATWLYAIVINGSRNRLKQLRSRRYREGCSIDDPIVTPDGELLADPPSGEPSALDRLEARDITQHVQGCINVLDTEFKEVIVLRDLQGFSYEEISAMLKVPVGTVKSRLFRGREAMRECLKGVMGDR
ncbi:MAG: sigma-70 family RNA polymerase sigma factor [Desulfobacterales bacterium]|nr:sigma-70 family RNA polymerase sigma factor [Desulfobacterales bacterium]